MADNTKSFQDILNEQRNTNRQLASLKKENRLMSDVLKDIREDAEKDSTTQGIVRSALPEIISDTANTKNQTAQQIKEFDQQQIVFADIAKGIQEMTGVLKAGNKQDAEFQADEDAQQERTEALRKSGNDDPLPAEGEGLSFLKDLKGGFSGIFGGLKGIFLGTAGIFAAVYAFVAALGNETFREIVFAATDAVTKAFSDFGDLIEGEMGLLEFLKENALTITAVTALLMPSKTFGLLKTAALGLPGALSLLGAGIKSISTIFSTTILPILGPIALVVAGVSTVLYGIKQAVDDGLAYFKETGNVLDSINFGLASFLGFMITLPAKIFTTVIDGALGLLEFFTFGWLNFDDIQENIRNMDFAGYMRDAIFDFFELAQNFIVDTVLNGTQFVIDLGIKLGDFAGEMLDGVVGFVKDIGKKIYNPETGEVLGMQLPELPTLGDMTQMLSDFAKKIYDPETGEIFGFKLPSLSDLNPFKGFSLFGDKDKTVDDYNDELAKNEAKAMNAYKAYSETGDEKYLEDYNSLKQKSLDAYIAALELDEKQANMQYEALMKKMAENEELTQAEKSYIQQINVIKGGDSVSQSSSTGFSTKKSAFNDDYTTQMLAGSMP